jgi:hypothetical protein
VDFEHLQFFNAECFRYLAATFRADSIIAPLGMSGFGHTLRESGATTAPLDSEAAGQGQDENNFFSADSLGIESCRLTTYSKKI